MKNDENYKLIHGLGTLGFISKGDEDFMLYALENKGKLSEEEKAKATDVLSGACWGVENALGISRNENR